MSRLLHDARYALRSFRRQPAFTVIAVLTLALGIGATTAVFTVVYGVLLRPLPYRDPGRLVMLMYGHQGRVSPWYSPLNLRDYVGPSEAFSASAAYAPITVNVTGSGDPERLQGARVSWNYFDVLGIAMAHGRAFVQADGQGAGDRIVLSDELWQRRFGGRPDVVGTTTTIDGNAVTIIGIAPPAFKFPATAEFWQPLVFTPRDFEPGARGRQWVRVLARLRDTVSAGQATNALQMAGTRLAREFPGTEKDATLQAIVLQERLVEDIRPTLQLLFGAVALVLLIACANVAGLLLARTQSRSREIAVRASLGASRGQLIMQLLSESLLIGFAGAALGVGLARVLVRALVAFGPATVPRLAELTIDATVLAFAVGAAMVTSLAFGLMPALWSSGWTRVGSAALTTRGAVGPSRTGARRLLVVCELALAVILLAGAGLLVRSYIALQQVETGFESRGVVTFNLLLPGTTYADPAHRGAFVSSLLSRLNAEPGVDVAAVAMGLPFSRLSALTGFRREDQPDADSATMPSASMRLVSADYFKVMRIPLRAGRLFDQRDSAAGVEVALINERTAQRFFAGVNPIGQRIRVSAQLARGVRNGPKTIVGLVGDVKDGGIDEETPADIYLPYDQHQVDAFTVAVRTTANPLAVVAALRRDVAELDPLLPIANLEQMPALVNRSLAGRRFTMSLFLAFAGVAVVLSVVGVYGVLSYLVAQRTREIGVRLAVGASTANVLWLIVREGIALSAMGLAGGLMGALAAGRWIATMLYQVTPGDATTFAGVICVVALAAVAATCVPARRASRVDPVIVLRSE